MKRASLIAMTLLAALSAQHGAWAVDYPLPPSQQPFDWPKPILDGTGRGSQPAGYRPPLRHGGDADS